MTEEDYFIFMGVGGFFLVLGLIAFIWGKREESAYFNTIATNTRDLREFMNHWPQRPQPGALKVGGWIAIAIGLLILAIGIALWLWAKYFV